MDTRALDRLFGAASVPKSLASLTGAHKGRVLAVHRAENGPVGEVLRWSAANQNFPWAGKTIEIDGDGRKGNGVNRILGGNLFKFEVRREKSLLDGKESVVLDYRRPQNGPIGLVHDEIRQVSPNLWLGKATLRRGEAKPAEVLFFALQTPKAG